MFGKASRVDSRADCLMPAKAKEALIIALSGLSSRTGAAQQAACNLISQVDPRAFPPKAGTTTLVGIPEGVSA